MSLPRLPRSSSRDELQRPICSSACPNKPVLSKNTNELKARVLSCFWTGRGRVYGRDGRERRGIENMGMEAECDSFRPVISSRRSPPVTG